MYEITSNTEGFNIGSTDNEIPKPKVGDVSTEEPDTDIISKKGVDGEFDNTVGTGESASREIVS